MALQEIREIQMQPVKLSTNTMRGLDISDLDHNRFALGFKLIIPTVYKIAKRGGGKFEDIVYSKISSIFCEPF